jgi:alpha-mannosidase
MNVADPRELTVFVVPHTHWDREWYLPFERFRMALVDVVDRLLDLMGADPGYQRFTLDGQSIVVDDYLAMRPERESSLRELVAQGRLSIGPWYVLADEFLVSGEALIRNLLFGRARAARLGRAMPVGYVPDTFGHIAQLPQILKGFGIASAVLARGLGNEGEALGDQFHWEALDGSRVLVIHQRRGYCNAAALGHADPRGLFEGRPADPELAAARVRREVQLLAPHSRAGIVVLNHGCDHLPPSPDLPRLIVQLRDLLPSFDIRWATPADVVEEVRVRGPVLPTWRGELRGSRYAPLLPGVLSTRIPLKQANQAVETLLERWAEPMAALASTLGEPHPKAQLEHAWRLLLQNHPHDSIGGCSVDQVHREMMTRFERAEAVGGEIATRALTALASRVGTDSLPEGLPLLVFNPLAWPRSGVVRCALSLPSDQASRLSFADGTGAAVPFQILRRSREVLTSARLPPDAARQRVEWLSHEVGIAWGLRFAAFRLEGNQLTIEAAEPGACPPDVLERIAATVEAADARQGITAEVKRTLVEVALATTDVPPTGYQSLVATRSRHGMRGAAEEVRVDGNRIENAQVAVELSTDGTIVVRDKRTSAVFRGHPLEDAGDAGDEYDYSPTDEPPVLAAGLPGRIETVHGGLLVGTLRAVIPLRLPARLSADRRRRVGRVLCKTTVEVTLMSGSPVVDFTTTVENQARDHRLRVLFATGLNASHWASDTAFGVIERSVTRPDGQGWAQPPQPTAPHQSWVDIGDGRAGLAILSAGLHEHEARVEGEGLTLALTLLRCVGWLSRDDLRTRPRHAGPAYDTPEAQCLGVHRFRYALLAHAGDWEHAELPARALEWAVSMRAEPATRHHGPLPFAQSFLACQGAIVSAIKREEAGEGLVVRLYNPTPTARVATIRTTLPLREVREVSLAEEDVADLARAGQGIELPIQPFQIRTIKLVTERS